MVIKYLANNEHQIRDGWEFHSPLVGNFCSSVVPPPVETTANVALINFYSDDKNPHKGFQISFFQKRGLMMFTIIN